MRHIPNAPRTFKWLWLRRTLQIAALVLFALPVIVAGWSLFGTSIGGDNPQSTPADLPFYGSLSSSTLGGFPLLDPFGILQIVAASKTFMLDWLIFCLPILLTYGLIRGRAFCGWICPVNLLLEGVDVLRRKLSIEVKEAPIPRKSKMWIALGVIAASAITSVPVFEAFSPISAINKGILFGSVTGIWVLVTIVIVELFWAHRVWCRALCPLGGFYESIGRMGLVHVRIDHQACINCDICQKVCLADPKILEPALCGKDSRVKAGDCMVCGECIDTCPTKALSFGVGYHRKPNV